MNDMLTEVRFWAQIIGDAKRTIVCNPDHESRIKGWIDARSMGGILSVVPQTHCPANRIFVIDEQAVGATLNRPLRPYLAPLPTTDAESGETHE